MSPNELQNESANITIMSANKLQTEIANHTSASIRNDVEREINQLIGSLPHPKDLSDVEARQIISRFTAVLEGNFIYWMTGALLAVKSEEARHEILENLHEEVRDSHPRMLREFAMAARAYPGESDAMAVHQGLTKVRLFVGRLSPVPILAMMAFFEGYLQKLMPFLAELAAKRGSTERVYTDVHGVCDVAHTQGLYEALGAEMERNDPVSDADLFEGVHLLGTLMSTIIFSDGGSVSAR
jgi:hypothetical protein